MPRPARPTRPYRLPIAIVQAGIDRPAGAVVELTPAQIVQVEEAARAAGVLPILPDPDQHPDHDPDHHTAPAEGDAS